MGSSGSKELTKRAFTLLKTLDSLKSEALGFVEVEAEFNDESDSPPGPPKLEAIALTVGVMRGVGVDKFKAMARGFDEVEAARNKACGHMLNLMASSIASER